MVTPLRVLIADDHPPTRAGVRQALEAGGLDVVAETATAQGAVELALQTRPSVCLLDIHMPGSGNAAAREITRRLPETAVVMLTASATSEDLFEALRAGAVGYLLKDIDPDRLPHALRGVMDGEAALPRTLVARVLDEFRQRPAGRRPRGAGAAARLTDREREVFELLREGLTTEEAAARMFVSPVTVRGYVSSTLKKLRAADRQSALDLLR